MRIQRLIIHSGWGFTLSELLVAIAILGIIATFTIPKVLSSTGTSRMHTAGKEAVSVLNQVLYEAWQNGSINENSTAVEISNYLKTKLNFQQFCDAGDTTGACNKPNAGGFWVNAFVGHRFILHSGVLINLFQVDEFGPDTVHFLIDANGNEGPNLDVQFVGSSAQAGESDIVALWFNPGRISYSESGRYTNLRPGELKSDELADRNLVFNAWFK